MQMILAGLNMYNGPIQYIYSLRCIGNIKKLFASQVLNKGLRMRSH